MTEYGINYLKCGTCPECLQERSAYWVLRCTAEARTRKQLKQPVCMVTLTYDDYLRDRRGEIVFAPDGTPLELPPDVKKLCNKRDVQLFMKRLRARFPDNDIKYLITAEHGKRTNRAHYHALLFGVSFDDIKPYKKSNRGNQIYKSKLLNEIWSNGICTVDSVVANPSIARYVTKYSMKARGCDDTFQLFSHGIGSKWLFENFTGRPYIIAGRSYPVPREIWQKYIMQKYPQGFFDLRFDPRYRAPSHPRHDFFHICNRNYRRVLHADPVYIGYREHMQKNAELFDSLRARAFSRVQALDESKYHAYKDAWFKAFRDKQYFRREAIIDPGCSVQSARNLRLRSMDPRSPMRILIENQLSGARSFAFALSCHNTANDRKIREKKKKCFTIQGNFFKVLDKSANLDYNVPATVRDCFYFS